MSFNKNLSSLSCGLPRSFILCIVTHCLCIDVVVKLSMKNDVIRVHEANGLGNPSKDGYTDLEKVLKEKTFTRYIVLQA